MRPSLLSLIVLIAWLGSGCTESRFEFLRHSVEIDRDPLCLVRVKAERGRFPIDLNVENFSHDDRLFLEAMIKGIREPPGLEVRTLTASGEEAFRVPRILRRRGAPPPDPAPWIVKLGVSHEFSGYWWNTFLAFPGMIPLLPAWRGYDDDLDLAFAGRLTKRGSEDWSDLSQEHRWEFREMNHPRSAAFHIWPSTGIYGTQFVLGLVMSPLMSSTIPSTAPRSSSRPCSRASAAGSRARSTVASRIEPRTRPAKSASTAAPRRSPKAPSLADVARDPLVRP